MLSSCLILALGSKGPFPFRLCVCWGYETSRSHTEINFCAVNMFKTSTCLHHRRKTVDDPSYSTPLMWIADLWFNLRWQRFRNANFSSSIVTPALHISLKQQHHSPGVVYILHNLLILQWLYLKNPLCLCPIISNRWNISRETSSIWSVFKIVTAKVLPLSALQTNSSEIWSIISTFSSLQQIINPQSSFLFIAGLVFFLELATVLFRIQ